MKRIYLDNAATTAPHPEVIDAMKNCLDSCWGNPSSIHAYGREARTVIDRARKQIAELIGASPSEIFFTSGGTEANNMVLRQSIHAFNLKHIISSPTEHHAVLHTLEELHATGKIQLHLLNIDPQGNIDQEQLEELLKENSHSLVSIMHANNEIGTKIDLEKIADLIGQNGGLFHSDAVQTMGHYAFDLKNTGLHFTNGAAHKFHGPKGIGFCYIKSGHTLQPFITGGAQERNMRAGTENLYGIVGLAKAMEIAYRNLTEDQQYVRNLKNLMIRELQQRIPNIEFNGDIAEQSLYTVLNVLLPECEEAEMALFKLDIQGIAVSGGSACSSGSNVGSHVIAAIKPNNTRTAIRFSFSKFNTPEEIIFVAETLQKMLQKNKIHA